MRKRKEAELVPEARMVDRYFKDVIHNIIERFIESGTKVSEGGPAILSVLIAYTMEWAGRLNYPITISLDGKTIASTVEETSCHCTDCTEEQRRMS